MVTASWSNPGSNRSGSANGYIPPSRPPAIIVDRLRGERNHLTNRAGRTGHHPPLEPPTLPEEPEVFPLEVPAF